MGRALSYQRGTREGAEAVAGRECGREVVDPVAVEDVPVVDPVDGAKAGDSNGHRVSGLGSFSMLAASVRFSHVLLTPWRSSLDLALAATTAASRKETIWQRTRSSIRDHEPGWTPEEANAITTGRCEAGVPARTEGTRRRHHGSLVTRRLLVEPRPTATEAGRRLG